MSASELLHRLRYGIALLDHAALVKLCEQAAIEIEQLHRELENREEQVARLKRERMWKP